MSAFPYLVGMFILLNDPVACLSFSVMNNISSPSRRLAMHIIVGFKQGFQEVSRVLLIV